MPQYLWKTIISFGIPDYNLVSFILTLQREETCMIKKNYTKTAKRCRVTFQYPLDSIDFLHFVLNVEKRLGVKISETDYPKLSSLNESIKYLELAQK